MFDRSVSSLQYTLATIEERLTLDVIEAGPETLRTAIAQFRVELEEAEAELPLLLDQARRAGVPAGVRREFED